MDPLKPVVLIRDDLLDDPRFWAQLYWSELEARVGDPFRDGPEYFLGVGAQAANDWLEGLAASPVGGGCFPEVSVTVPLRNAWRAGVVLSCYPEDFGIEEILVPPGRPPVMLSASAGTTWLPGLRWEELLAIADAVRPDGAASRERAVLLLFNSVGLTGEVFAREARPVLRDCWQASGQTIRHLDAFLDRLGESSFSMGRWEWSETFGWIHDGNGSPRNPDWRRGPPVWPVVRELFGSLDPSASG